MKDKMSEAQQPGFETLCMHFAEDRESNNGAAAPPIYQCSTFTYPDAETFNRRTEPSSGRYDYTRVANPTTRILEEKIAALEQAEAARACGSGMAAISAAVLSCVRSGDHIVTIETIYGPTRTLFCDYLPKFNIKTTFVRGTRIEQYEKAIRSETKLIYVESPSSLVFELQDLKAVAELARSRGIATICDNSTASPFNQNPVAFGIDLVVHSATKYLGGHSDIVSGMIAGSRERIRRIVKLEGELLGGVLDPFASWLMLRGLRTLPVRMERHNRNAKEIARLLESDARVARVYYTGSEQHPQAALARRQMRGYSGMLSFTLRDGSREAAFRFINALKYFCIAVSWGGYESLAIPLEVKDPETGTPIWIVRLSVGLESLPDLKADIYHALNEAVS